MSYAKDVLIRGRHGSGATDVEDVRIDASTHSLQTISYAHHEIHGGAAYSAAISASGGSGTKATISFTTPDTTTWAHLVIIIRSNVEAQLTFGEAVTVTAASGADLAPFNRNRNSGNTSGMISNGSAGGAGNVTTGAIVTSFGTELVSGAQVGSGKDGDDARGIAEWVLKQNTAYAVELESQASSSEVYVELNWYEHTDKD